LLPALFLKVRTLQTIEKFQESIESLDKVLELEPENDEAWFLRGISLEYMNNLKKHCTPLTVPLKSIQRILVHGTSREDH